jgi:hypothetical protein
MATADGGFGMALPAHPEDQPPAVVGPGAAAVDGILHVAWWRGAHHTGSLHHDAGVWYARCDVDGCAPPRSVLTDPAAAVPVEVVVDAAGTPWIATLAGANLRLFRVGQEIDEVEEVAVPVRPSSEVFDLAPLPEGGVLVLWYEDDHVMARRVDVREATS